MASIYQGFKWLGCPVFKGHSKTGPFGIRPFWPFEYRKSLVFRPLFSQSKKWILANPWIPVYLLLVIGVTVTEMMPNQKINQQEVNIAWVFCFSRPVLNSHSSLWSQSLLLILFRQVNTSTGHNQLPVFHCTNVHLRRNTCPLFQHAIQDDIMSQSELTTSLLFRLFVIFLSCSLSLFGHSPQSVCVWMLFDTSEFSLGQLGTFPLIKLLTLWRGTLSPCERSE